MQRLVFWLAYPILWGISILPYRLFYLFSDFAFFLIFYVVGYRKKVVAANLRLAFPEKSEEEILKIRKKFYRHFCDLFLEMAKTLTISEEELKSRFILKNPEEMKRLESLNKSYVIMLAHYNSYEWVIALRSHGMNYKAYGVYQKIENKYFDDLICKSRGRFETTMVSKKESVKEMIKNKRDGVLSAYGMIADQAPSLGIAKYWRPFFGHVVPVYTGGEEMAKRMDHSVTYLKIDKVKRGYYEAELVPITDNPKDFPDYEITDKYIELVEQQIREKPEFYLWSHKRWKHEGKREEIGFFG